jgi:hypothetical protein
LRMLLVKVVILDIRSLDFRHDVVAKVLALRYSGARRRVSALQEVRLSFCSVDTPLSQ